MDFEPWWLLPIPALFFALGWIAARIDIKHLLHRVARAAALVLPRAQLPAERAAGQGDRVVHRSGQGRSADDRPAFRARQPVPPPGRDRPRDPHAPEPPRPARPARRTGATTATFELAQDFHRAGLLDRAEELFIKLDGTPFEHAAQGFLHLDLRDGEGLAARRSRSPGAWRRSARRRTSRRSRTTTASSRRRRWCAPTSRSRAREIDLALAEYRACARATMLAGDIEAQQGRYRRGGRHMGSASSRRTRRSWRSSPSASPTPTRSSDDAAQGIRVLGSWQAQLSVARRHERAVLADACARGCRARRPIS